MALESQPGESVDMAYVDSGDSSAPHTLLLLHGLFDQGGTWRFLLPHFDERFRLIAPDLIGSGHSDKPRLESVPPAERYTIGMHAGHLRELVRGLDLKDVILVGNSLGGAIALWLVCTAWPQGPRVRGLVLIDAAAYPQELPGHIREAAGRAGALLENRLVRCLALRLGIVERVVRSVLRNVYFDHDKIPPELVEDAIEVIRSDNGAYAARLAAQNVVPPDASTFPEKYRQIDCPTLIVWGREDSITSPLCALRLEADIPGARLHVFDECGHAPQLEYPLETAVLIRDWVLHSLR